MLLQEELHQLPKGDRIVEQENQGNLTGVEVLLYEDVCKAAAPRLHLPQVSVAAQQTTLPLLPIHPGKPRGFSQLALSMFRPSGTAATRPDSGAGLALTPGARKVFDLLILVN